MENWWWNHTAAYVQSHPASQLWPLCLIEWDAKSPYSIKAEFNYCDGLLCVSGAQWQGGGGGGGSHTQLQLHCRIIRAEAADKGLMWYGVLSMMNVESLRCNWSVFGSNHTDEDGNCNEEQLISSTSLLCVYLWTNNTSGQTHGTSAESKWMSKHSTCCLGSSWAPGGNLNVTHPHITK